MIRNSYGHRVVFWCPGFRRCRVRQWCPRHRQTWLHIVGVLRWYLVRWTPYVGWECLTSGPVSQPVVEPETYYPTHKEADVKRREQPAGVGVPQVPLPAASVLLGKLPGVREFVTATSYEDGTIRTPGYLTLRNRQVTFEITLYDPDSGSRLVARAAKLDDVLALVEQLLGVTDAPWEVDDYLTAQLTRRGRKRGKTT